MTRTTSQLLYYEHLGEDFDRWMSCYDVARRAAMILDDLLADIDLRLLRVLEVGCGTGRITARLAERGAEVLVTDIGLGLTRATATGGGGAGGFTSDAARLPLADASVDLVVSSECVEHCLDPERAIRELCRVVRPGGVVCLTTPNRLWYPLLVAARVLRLRRFAGIEHWLWPRQVRRIMRDSTMTGVRCSGCHLWPFQILPLRPLSRRLDRYGRVLFPAMINFGVVATRRTSGAA